MLSEPTREKLHSIGVFFSNDRLARHKQEYNPFFTIEANSVEITEEEFALLAKITQEYRTLRFHERETRDVFWGKIANTIMLWKREDGWRFRRMTWTNRSSWAPQSGQTIEELVEVMFR